MILIKLRHAMKTYEEKTGEKLTYSILAQRTKIAESTLQAIGSRPTYNPTLSTVNKICQALGCSINELLEYRNI